MPALTKEEVKHIKQKHKMAVKGTFKREACFYCDQDWPCEVAKLVATLEYACGEEY